MNASLTNQPDPTPDILRRLAVDYDYLAEAVDNFDTEASALPTSIRDDNERHEFAEILARMTKTSKSIEAARAAEKAPFLASERAVDGYFKGLATRLGDVVSDLQNCLTSYLRMIREAEQRKREQEAAEQRRIADEARKAEEIARARAEASKRASDRRNAEEEAALARSQARLADILADDAAVAAAVKPADMVRGRSERGALSTLRTTWTFEIENMEELDWARLFPFIQPQHVEMAIRAFIRAGHRDLRGVRIYEITNAQVRG